MQINWFTVIAQVINFLVLVWLMKKYLYKPILQAIDDREKKIASELADAKTQKVEAKSEQDEFQKKNDAFDQDKKGMMDKAVADSNEERQKLLDAAKNEAAAVRSKLEKAAEAMQENFNGQIAQQVQQEVFSITKKALAELASTNLEEQAINVFIRQIKEIKDKEKTQFIDAFQADSTPVSVTSAFDLNEKEQKNITTAIGGILGPGIRYAFETDPKMISGIELSTNGYKLSWSFSAYIDSLEKSITETVKKKTAPNKKKQHVTN
jgi:F-type H+-transporting ATPase subunit b